MHPTLLVGPADWDPAQLPRGEFGARLDALWQAEPSAGGAIIFGDSRQHAELAYFTNFTPKLEAGLALIARPNEKRSSEGTLLVGVGVNMLASARPLTWVETLAPLRDAGATVAQWARELEAKRLLMIGATSMPQSLHRDIVAGLGGVVGVDADAGVRARMRRKSACEAALIRRGCATLDAAVAALTAATRSGAGVTASILAAEHAALRCGAQDVRTLFSLDRGRTLRPFRALAERSVDPLQAYMAVRHAGYWAEAFVTLSAERQAAAETARAALQSCLPMLLPGAKRGDLADSIAQAVGAPHPATREPAVSIGLALEESVDRADVLFPGEVLSLRAGVSDRDGAAIASAMVAVGDSGPEILWSQARISDGIVR